jgi:hypothetical protein
VDKIKAKAKVVPTGRFATEVGFEPTHALHIGLAGQRLNHSAILPPLRRLNGASLFPFFNQDENKTLKQKSCPTGRFATEVGFEPTHALHIGLAGQRLNHSAILPPLRRYLSMFL